MNLDVIKKDCLVFDIETFAEYQNGTPINIKTNFDDYVALAYVRWVGIYSYKHNKEYYLEVSKDRQNIIDLFNEHNILIGFNNEQFDCPIMINNGLINSEKRYLYVDCMKILGSSKFKDKKGFKYKDRGNLMGYTFKKHSLEHIAEVMELNFNKGSIDYELFRKTNYSNEEKKEIIEYLKNDTMATKEMFDKLWNYWMPFTEMLDEKNINNLSWIRGSIASLIYKSACFYLGTEPTYSENPKKKEQMGGNVITPKYEEAYGVWYLDVSSLYPHIMAMFNLFNEVSKDNVIAWHGNDLFKVKGYYDISYKSKMTSIVEEKLKQRDHLRKSDPLSAMIYTIKIWLNGLYGVIRSALFEKLHTENAGWDTCWLGQQFQELFSNMMFDFGFETIAGDTDSILVKALKEEYNNREYVQKCINKVIKKIFENVPFPVNTFDIKIENYLEYIMFPFSEEPLIEDEDIRSKLRSDVVDGYIHALDEKDKKIIVDEKSGEIVKKGNSWIKKRIGKKKNYMYLYEEDGEVKIEIVGLPIKKDNATPLGYKIFEEVLKEKIIKNKRGKFPKEFIDETINNYLKNDEIMKLLAVEYKVQPENTYKIPKGKKEATGIHAQISRGYFNGQEGVISLIKNKKVGNAGKGLKYCTVEQAIENNLTIDDLDLEKVYNELNPFIEYLDKGN